MFQFIKKMLILGQHSKIKYKNVVLNDDSLFKGKSYSYLPYPKKVIAHPNHEFTMINHNFWKAEFNFASLSQVRLLPDLLNQRIT